MEQAEDCKYKEEIAKRKHIEKVEMAIGVQWPERQGKNECDADLKYRKLQVALEDGKHWRRALIGVVQPRLNKKSRMGKEKEKKRGTLKPKKFWRYVT
jgi:hypothetical protein